jgi:hypothetical protein
VEGRPPVLNYLMSIYTILMNPSSSLDHARLLQHLSDGSCESAEDLEYAETSFLEDAANYLKPIQKKKLLTLLEKSRIEFI